jgi:hypothetical protein
MSAVSLTLHQTTTVTPASGGASYQATSVVEAAFGIDKAVFVFRTDTQGFDHHATPADLETVTTSRDLALAERQPFYRQDRLTRTWPTLSLMQDDVAVTRSRLRGLVREVSQAVGPAVIDMVTVIEAG